MAEKIFCGSGKKKEFENGGSITTIVIDLDTIMNNYDSFGFTTNGGKRTMKLKVSTKQNVDNYGNTHSVEIDTWMPDSSYNNQNQNNQSQQQTQPSGPTFSSDEEDDLSDIPF